jgi:hypothetical protein
MSAQLSETQGMEAKIADAAATTEALARQYFGADAYLRRDVHENRETGDEQVVFEVHYCFPDPDDEFERLAALHDTFMSAFVGATSPDILYRIILKPIASDAN